LGGKLAAFDMDGTLTDGRLVFALAHKIGLTEKVEAIQSSLEPGYKQSKAIAMLFKELTTKDIEIAIESIPLSKNCELTVSTLREKNYKIGIISDSYTIAAQVVADRLGGMDFVVANELLITHGKLTGGIRMPLGWEKIGCFCMISVCKRYYLEKHAKVFDVQLKDAIAVGDTKSDLCMVQRAGTGIAFMPKDEKIAKATNNVVEQPDLAKVLEFVT